MKINEIDQQLDEGIWDKAKQIGAGAVGAVRGAAGAFQKGGQFAPIQGAKAGATASAAATKQTDLVRRVTQKAVADWATFTQNMKLAGTPITPETATQWFSKYTGGQSPKNPVLGTSPASMQQWLEKEIAGYMASKAAGTQQPAPSPEAEPEQPEQPAAETPPEQPVKPMPENPIQVKTPTGETIVKKDDGNWYDEDDAQIVNQKDIAELERRAKIQRQTTQMANKPAAQPVPSDTQQPEQPAAPAAETPPEQQTTQQPAQTQQPAETPLPDISTLTPEERAELRRRLQAA